MFKKYMTLQIPLWVCILTLLVGISGHWILTPKVPHGLIFVDEEIYTRLQDRAKKINGIVKEMPDGEFKTLIDSYMTLSQIDRELNYRMMKSLYKIYYGD